MYLYNEVKKEPPEPPPDDPGPAEPDEENPKAPVPFFDLASASPGSRMTWEQFLFTREVKDVGADRIHKIESLDGTAFDRDVMWGTFRLSCPARRTAW